MKSLTGKNKYFSKIKRLFGKTPDIFHRNIGEVLRQGNIITEEQLQHALKVQREKLYTHGKAVRLGQIIVGLGYASEKELVKAIKENYDITIKSLADDIKGLVNEKRGRFAKGLPPPRIPIWLQLFAVTIVVIITTVLLLSFVNLSQQKERLYRQTVNIGKVSLNYFVSNASIPLLDDDVLRLNTLIKEATAIEGLLYAIIVNRDKVIKAHTDINKINMAFEKFDNVEDIRKEDDVTYFNHFLEFGEHVLNLSQPIVFKNKELGEVHVGVSIDFIEKLIHKERLSIIVITVFIILFGIGIAVWLGLRFSRPIQNLVLATQEIGSGNYQHKIILARNDELGNLATAFNRMGDELWKNSLMQQSFGKYIGSEVLDMIMANPESDWLKGHKNEATIVFTDIRGFASYSEGKKPEEIVDALNEYFEIATQVILDHGGYVDKFIGDAVLGVFGVPVYHKEHTERAVRASIDMQKEFHKERGKGNNLLKSVGISIDSGVVVSGNIGSQVKMEYTVIGDSVNVASRLNGLAGPGEIIISKSVNENLGDMISVEELSEQYIKGKTEPIETFKLLSINKKPHGKTSK